MSAGFIITGTDTGVGKTVFAAGLVRFLGGRYWKPVQSGLEGETDAEAVRRLSGAKDSQILREVYRLRTPVSPHLAAERDGLEIDLARLALPAARKPLLETVGAEPRPGREPAGEQTNVVALKPRAAGRHGLVPVDGGAATQKRAHAPLVVEGAGGLMVPLNRQSLQIDLFEQWALPVIVVARTTLGTINHTLMTIDVLRRRGLTIQGIAFSGDANEDSEHTIATFGRVRRLGRLPRLAPLDCEQLTRAFDVSFQREDFER